MIKLGIHELNRKPKIFDMNYNTTSFERGWNYGIFKMYTKVNHMAPAVETLTHALPSVFTRTLRYARTNRTNYIIRQATSFLLSRRHRVIDIYQDSMELPILLWKWTSPATKCQISQHVANSKLNWKYIQKAICWPYKLLPTTRHKPPETMFIWIVFPQSKHISFFKR